MKRKPQLIRAEYGLLLVLLWIVPAKADEPTSTVPQGEQFMLYDPDGGDSMNLSTSETPTPDCPDDAPSGDPDWIWDFGQLDGDDSSDDGNLTITNDVSGSYDVTVFCSQDFTDSEGNDYTEVTYPCDPNEHFQKPVTLTPGNPSAIADPVAGAFPFTIKDEDGLPIITNKLTGVNTDISLLETEPNTQNIWIFPVAGGGSSSKSYTNVNSFTDAVAATGTDGSGTITDTPVSIGTKQQVLNTATYDLQKYGVHDNGAYRDINTHDYKVKSGKYTSPKLLSQHQVISCTITWNGNTPSVTTDTPQAQTVP